MACVVAPALVEGPSWDNDKAKSGAEKEAQKLRKKIRQIEQIEEKVRAGEKIDPLQLSKINKKNELDDLLQVALNSVVEEAEEQKEKRLLSQREREFDDQRQQEARSYHVKNTFLSIAPEAPKSMWLRMQSCPDNICYESTKDSLPSMKLEEIDAPELDDSCSNASEGSLPDVETNWQRMQTEEHCWDQAAPQRMQSEERRWEAVLECTSPGNAYVDVDCAEWTTPSHSHVFSATAKEWGAWSATDLSEFDGKTTVMMRNLPNKYSRSLLLEDLSRKGYQGSYDFFYLPMDATTQANKGYAFINFTTAAYAKSFKVAYENTMMPLFNSLKTISVTVASLQGFESNYAHYANARCNKGDPATRPLFLRECEEHLKPFGRRRPLKLTQKRCEEPAKVSSGSKFCASCGAGDQLGHRFCSECGHRQS